MDDAIINNGEIYGKIPYLAPEVLNSGLYTKAADVYSFGIILWELTSCRIPFSNMSQDASLMARIINGKRPEIIEGTPPEFAKLIQECWNKDPILRPTMEEVYKKIKCFSNSMIIGNRRDRYGFKAAEKNRYLRLSLLTMKNVYPEIIRSQQIGSILSIQSIPRQIPCTSLLPTFIKHGTPQIEIYTENYGNVPSIKIDGTDCFIKIC